MRRKYTNDDKNQIFQMRKDGLSYKEIAERVGRTSGGIAAFVKYQKEKAQGKKIKVTHKQKRGDKIVEMVASQNKEAAKSRPMFALVGERAEIAQTLRELFS